MTDIQILVSVRRSMATVSGVSDRGQRWIRTNMTKPGPVTISDDAVDELREQMEREQLEVSVR